MITEETIARVKSSLQATKSFLALELIEQLEKENEQLKCDLYNTDANLQHITIEYENENTELKEKHKSDKQALKLIVEKGVKLEKENAELNRDKIELANSVTELKTKVTELKIKVTELEKENKEILEDNDTLNKWVDELRLQIEELQINLRSKNDLVEEFVTQIEKMKCCRNCLYENDDEELEKEMKNNQDPCIDCKKLNYKNWRLYK